MSGNPYPPVRSGSKLALRVDQTDHGRGEIAFGALQATFDIEYVRSSIGFTWEGFEEMDEVSGGGSAELLDDGSIEIEFTYHGGDEAVFNSLLARMIFSPTLVLATDRRLPSDFGDARALCLIQSACSLPGEPDAATW